MAQEASADGPFGRDSRAALRGVARELLPVAIRALTSAQIARRAIALAPIDTQNVVTIATGTWRNDYAAREHRLHLAVHCRARDA